MVNTYKLPHPNLYVKRHYLHPFNAKTPFTTTRAKTILTETNLATSFCVKPLAISLALYLSIVPYELYLIQYTHFQPMRNLLGGKEVSVQLLFNSKVTISLSMVALQSEDLTAW